MSVELYEGCYGVTAGGGIEGKFFARWERPGWEWGVQRIDRMWSVAGVRFPMAYEPETDITSVHPTREAAEAHLRGEPTPVGLFAALTPQQRAALAFVGNPDFGPADPQPVTWPPGVHCVKIGPHTVALGVGREIQVECPGSGGASPSQARQLAALLVAAADYIERGEE